MIHSPQDKKEEKKIAGFKKKTINESLCRPTLLIHDVFSFVMVVLELNCPMIFRKILQVQKILQFSSIFCMLRSVWFWDPTFHIEDNLGTHTTIKKGSNMYWRSRRKPNQMYHAD